MWQILKELWGIFSEKVLFFKQPYWRAVYDFLEYPRQVVEEVESDPKQTVYVTPGNHLLTTVTLFLAMVGVSAWLLPDEAATTVWTAATGLPEKVFDWLQWVRTSKWAEFGILCTINFGLLLGTLFVVIRVQSVSQVVTFFFYLTSISLLIITFAEFAILLIAHGMALPRTQTETFGFMVFILGFLGFTSAYYARYFKSEQLRFGLFKQSSALRAVALVPAYCLIITATVCILYYPLLRYLNVTVSEVNKAEGGYNQPK